MTITLAELTRDILLVLVQKSGVREWDDENTREALGIAAIEMAANIWNFSSGYTNNMALPDSFKTSFGTAKTFKSSGGDAAITLANVANNAARQSAKIDLGALRAEAYSVECHFEIAATPTAGNVIELYWAPSTSGTAATDNPGGVSGSDAAYSGYSSNLDASVKQLQRIGAFICTAQATATVQKQTLPAAFMPLNRYGTLVVYNKSGAALHSSDTNIVVKFHPIEGTVED